MPASEPKKLPGIFISYRRSDTPDAVGRIYDRLVSEFGKTRVFKDVDSIPLGQDFRGHLNDIVGGCAAVLAIIGPRWTEIRNEAGQKRLDDPDDFVRIELEAALARNVPVVPVLVGHAVMPGASQLPSLLGSLVYRQSIEVRPDPDFHHDATRLVSALKAIVDPDAPQEETAEALSASSKAVALANLRIARRLGWMTALAAAGILAALVLALPALRYLRQAAPQELRSEIVTPATDEPGSFALSPDGRQIVFVAKGDGVSRLWLRPLSSTITQPLPGTDGATAPFWSPDGRSIGFFAERSMKRLDLGGGNARVLAPGGTVSIGTWNQQGDILFVQGPASPILRIAAAGGATTEAVQLGATIPSPRAPHFLPDGRHFLFLSIEGSAPGIYLGYLDGKDPVQLSPDRSSAAYHPSGWMLWGRGRAVLAQRLDVDKAMLVGEPITVADGVAMDVDGAASLSVSKTGLLAYRSGGSTERQLQWFDRAGAAAGTVGSPDGTLQAPRVSPDDRQVAFYREAQGKDDIWLQEGERASRVTFDGTYSLFPTWSPDGTRIAFTSRREGSSDLYVKRMNGSGEDELLVRSDQVKYASSWSPDGRFLLYFSVDPETSTDIWIVPMTGERKPTLFLKTPFFEVWGQFSPDGRWVAFQSNLTGRDEIYVRSFVPPGADAANVGDSAGQWQVSTGGGISPTWSADGKELFFIDPSGAMMAAPITVTGATLTPGAPVRLFQTRVLGGGIDAAQGTQYDVASDGRFLINTLPDIPAPPITLIQNWNPDGGK